MNKLPTLYKRNQHWTISTNGCYLQIEYGTLRGRNQVDAIQLPTPEKAQAEAQSRWNKKVERESYSEQPYNWPKTPMLSLEYFEHAHKLPQVVMAQPKLDGFRCVANNVEMMSRQNTAINSMPHIKDALQSLPDGILLDGELYCHGRPFQDHLTIIKRDNVHQDFMDIKYHVYDIQAENEIYSNRNARLELILKGMNHPYIQFVPTTLINRSNGNIEELRDHYIDQGYEGVMLRDPNSYYEYGVRAATLQKYKREDTTDFQIVDWTAAERGREKGCIIAVCAIPSRHPTFTPLTFTARLKGDLHYRREMMKSPPALLPNLKARILHYGYHSSGLPKQPRCDSYFYGSTSS